MTAHPSETGDAIEVGMARVELVSRGVIDIQQDRIVERGRFGAHQREEVLVDERGADVPDQLCRDGEQPTLVPVDHGGERVDHVE